VQTVEATMSLKYTEALMSYKNEWLSASSAHFHKGALFTLLKYLMIRTPRRPLPRKNLYLKPYVDNTN